MDTIPKTIYNKSLSQIPNPSQTQYSTATQTSRVTRKKMEVNNNELNFKPPKVCSCTPEEYDPPIEDHTSCLAWIAKVSPMWLPEKREVHNIKGFNITMREMSKERIRKWTKTSRYRKEWLVRQKETLNKFSSMQQESAQLVTQNPR